MRLPHLTLFCRRPHPGFLILPVLFLIEIRTEIFASQTSTGTTAEKLCSAYESIETIACSVRKTTSGPDGRVTLLSRVFYEKPDRIHIENIAPQKRRIIADGTKLYYHEYGRKRGYAESIPKLSDTFLNALRNQPATPLEHLRKLKGLTEEHLKGTESLPDCKGYKTPKLYVVLSLDPQGRLAQLAFYETPTMHKKTAQYTYSRFVSASDECWIPCLHKCTLYLPDGQAVTETRRIDELAVNRPIAQGLFNPAAFFKGIEFVDDLMKTYE